MYLNEDLKIEVETKIIDMSYDHQCDLKQLAIVIRQCFNQGSVSHEDNLQLYDMLFRRFSSIADLCLYVTTYQSDKSWMNTPSYRFSLLGEKLCTFLKSVIVNRSA